MGQNLGKGFTDCAFRQGVTFIFNIGRICQQQQNPSLTQFSQTGQIGFLPVDRRLVKLEVTGMHQNSGRRVDGVTNAINN